jgi:hypothetical protein
LCPAAWRPADSQRYDRSSEQIRLDELETRSNASFNGLSKVSMLVSNRNPLNDIPRYLFFPPVRGMIPGRGQFPSFCLVDAVARAA